ncbi:hypothetical protein BKA70DRAFT_1263719 [Coprinopsis sp. MPI-PUGE-AT-0042]|nr:hypothetical protein BKA70DRAFT_1263719 [Coprinopsis sp. MPI-PUGE-AT-0042]
MREFKRAKTIRKDLKFSLDENTPPPSTTSYLKPRLQYQPKLPTAPLIDLTLNIPSSKDDPLAQTIKPETFRSPSKHVEIQEARTAWNDYRTSQLELGMKRFEEVAMEWLHLRTADRDQTRERDPIARGGASQPKRTLDRSETVRQSDFHLGGRFSELEPASELDFAEDLQSSFGFRKPDQAPLSTFENATFESDDAFEDLWERDRIDTSPLDGSDCGFGDFDDDDDEEAWSPLSSSPSSSSSSSPSSPLSPPSPFSFNEGIDDWSRANSPSNEYNPSPIAKATPYFTLSRRRHAIDLEFSDDNSDSNNDTDSEDGGDDFYLDFPHPDPTASSPCCRHIDPEDLPSFLEIFYAPDADFNT